MKSFVGYTVIVAEDQSVVEPLLLCETPEKVRACMEHPDGIGLEIAECPAVVALECLSKADNVFGDAFAEDALRKCLAKTRRLVEAIRPTELKAVPSKLPGISVLNIPRDHRRWLEITRGYFNLVWQNVHEEL